MTSRNNSWAAVAFVMICLFHLSLTHPTSHNSWSQYGDSQFQDECKTNGDVETLCQTCAKQTRSNIVYPMCCEEREDARKWCESYMNYGRQT